MGFISVTSGSVLPEKRKGNEGSKRIDLLILYKLLVLQQLFQLSDKESLSSKSMTSVFEEFLDLDVMNTIPDASTIPVFRAAAQSGRD